MATKKDADEGVPRAVAAQGRKADQLQEQLLGKGNTDEGAKGKKAEPEEHAAQPNEPQEPQPTPPATGEPHKPEPQPAAAGEGDGEDTWKHKYDVLQGKYDKEILNLQKQTQRQNQVIQDQADMINGLLKQVEAHKTGQGSEEGAGTAGAPAGMIPSSTGNLNPEDYEGYGQEIVDLVSRFNALEARNAELERGQKTTAKAVSQTAEEAMWSYLDKQVTDWETINKDPAFLNWLAQNDPLTGVQRQRLLDAALTNFDGARVASFFTLFKGGNGAAQPGGETPPSKHEKPQQVILPEETGAGEGAPEVESTHGQAQTITREAYLKAQKDVQTGRMSNEEFEKLANRYMKQVTQAQRAAG